MSGNSTTSLIIVLLVVVVLTAGMIITLETRVDNVSQQEAQKMVEDFVADVANTGTLTKSQYQTFQSQLNAKTGKNCDIELEAQILDENPGKKTAQANYCLCCIYRYTNIATNRSCSWKCNCKYW